MNARYISVHNVSSSSFQLISLKPNIYTLYNTLLFSFCDDLNLVSLQAEARKLKVFESRVPKKKSAPRGK
jgi:hypothetical protein